MSSFLFFPSGSGVQDFMICSKKACTLYVLKKNGWAPFSFRRREGVRDYYCMRALSFAFEKWVISFPFFPSWSGAWGIMICNKKACTSYILKKRMGELLSTLSFWEWRTGCNDMQQKSLHLLCLEKWVGFFLFFPSGSMY